VKNIKKNGKRVSLHDDGNAVYTQARVYPGPLVRGSEARRGRPNYKRIYGSTESSLRRRRIETVRRNDGHCFSESDRFPSGNGRALLPLVAANTARNVRKHTTAGRARVRTAARVHDNDDRPSAAVNKSISPGATTSGESFSRYSPGNAFRRNSRPPVVRRRYFPPPSTSACTRVGWWRGIKQTRFFTRP